MKKVYPDLAKRLEDLTQEFTRLGEEMSSIFLMYLPEYGTRFVRALDHMRYWSDYAKKCYGYHNSLVNGLKELVEDWNTLHIFLTAAFNNGAYHKKQWIYWEEMYKLIEKLETLTEEFEKRYNEEAYS